MVIKTVNRKKYKHRHYKHPRLLKNKLGKQQIEYLAWAERCGIDIKDINELFKDGNSKEQIKDYMRSTMFSTMKDRKTKTGRYNFDKVWNDILGKEVDKILETAIKPKAIIEMEIKRDKKISDKIVKSYSIVNDRVKVRRKVKINWGRDTVEREYIITEYKSTKISKFINTYYTNYTKRTHKPLNQEQLIKLQYHRKKLREYGEL